MDDSSAAPGSLKWKFTTRKDYFGIDTPPKFGPNGTLYLATSSGDIVALDAAGNSSVAAGSVKWTYISKHQMRSPLVLGPDGTLFVGADSFT